MFLRIAPCLSQRCRTLSIWVRNCLDDQCSLLVINPLECRNDLSYGCQLAPNIHEPSSYNIILFYRSLMSFANCNLGFIVYIANIAFLPSVVMPRFRALKFNLFRFFRFVKLFECFLRSSFEARVFKVGTELNKISVKHSHTWAFLTAEYSPNVHPAMVKRNSGLNI